MAPLLEFEQADEAPALTFGSFDDGPGEMAAFTAAAPSPADDAVMRLEAAPLAGDEREPLPLVTGPHDLGEVPLVEAPRAPVIVDAFRPAAVPYADGYGDAEIDVGDDAGVAQRDEHDSAPRARPSGVPGWALWAGAIVAGVAVFGLGGRALLRWGTPSVPSAVVTTASTAPATTSTASTTSTTSTTSTASAGSAPTATKSADSAATPAPPAQPQPSSPAAARTRESAAERRDTPAPAAPRAGAPARPPAPAVAPPPAASAAQRKTPPAKTPPAKAPVRPVTPPAPARETPRPAAASASPAPGRLLVRSTPSGAEVFVNGERRGVSPVAVRDLPLGAYTVRVVRPGFEVSQQRVVLEAGRPARALEVALTRAGAAVPGAAPAAAATATTGSLLIESRPSGAQAFIDGVDVGRTPVTVPAAAVGARAVRIELAGYLTISTTTRVEPGVRGRVAVTLTAERPR